ncbi:hypothetical protein BC831DRAFT_450168, partial [Entophlyctis helioformis]
RQAGQARTERETERDAQRAGAFSQASMSTSGGRRHRQRPRALTGPQPPLTDVQKKNRSSSCSAL